MGVMACDRKGCRRVMCDDLPDLGEAYGEFYICGDCRSELTDRLKRDPAVVDEYSAEGAILRFLDSPLTVGGEKDFDAEAYLKGLIR